MVEAWIIFGCFVAILAVIVFKAFEYKYDPKIKKEIDELLDGKLSWENDY